MTTTETAELPGTMTIGQVGALTGITPSTLRFYEQEQLFFAPIRRDGAGRRVFTADEVEWLRVCIKLRSSGMPLPEIRRYALLAREGAGTEAERLELLRAHEARVQAQVADLQAALDVIHRKVAVYSAHLAAGAADDRWGTTPAGGHEPLHGSGSDRRSR